MQQQEIGADEPKRDTNRFKGSRESSRDHL